MFKSQKLGKKNHYFNIVIDVMVDLNLQHIKRDT